MSIKLKGLTNGSIELDVPNAVGSDLQVTLPATAGEVVVKAANGSVDLGGINIDSSGNVGVGISTPSTDLHVDGTWTDSFGTVCISGPADALNGIGLRSDNAFKAGVFYRDGTTGDYLDLYTSGANPVVVTTNNTERMRIDSSGNVGIGTTSPSCLLNTLSSSTGEFARFASSATTGEINISVGYTVTNQVKLGYDIANGDGILETNASGSSLLFKTVNAERMRIDSLGNVGIGTTSPINSANFNTLQLGNGSSTSGQIALKNTTNQNVYLWHDANGVNIYNQSATSQIFYTGATERLRIDSSGRLLVGTSSASGYSSSRMIITGAGTDATGSGNLVLQVGQANGSITANEQIGSINFGDTSGYSYASIIASADLAAGSDSPGRLVFSTTADGASSSTERMRISANGSITAGGVIQAGGFSFYNVGGGPAGSQVLRTDMSGNNDAPSFVGWRCYSNNTGTRFAAAFHNPNGLVGTISTNGTATSFTTSSDYRLKENVINIADGITRVKQLSPRRFNFIADDTTTVDGFLAHEAQTVVPEAVIGTKDEVDDDGNAVMQGIDQSKLVPLLTAALQEAIAKIETLETKVAALEATS